MIEQRQVTKIMLETARASGWNASQAADYFGFHRQSIRDAAARLGVALPIGRGAMAVGRDKARDIATASDARVKAWSASPSAIAKALAAAQARRAAMNGAKP